MFAKIRRVALYSENYQRMATFYQKGFIPGGPATLPSKRWNPAASARSASLIPTATC